MTSYWRKSRRNCCHNLWVLLRWWLKTRYFPSALFTRLVDVNSIHSGGDKLLKRGEHRRSRRYPSLSTSNTCSTSYENNARSFQKSWKSIRGLFFRQSWTWSSWCQVVHFDDVHNHSAVVYNSNDACYGHGNYQNYASQRSNRGFTNHLGSNSFNWI